MTELSRPGTYLLALHSPAVSRLRIGRLGEFDIAPGYYLYVGSAFGPGGVAARVKHHHAVSARPHWHVDYLRRVAGIAGSWCVHGQRLECDWARRIYSDASFSVPVAGFGASDCGCVSHLFFTRRRPVAARLEPMLGCALTVVGAAPRRSTLP